MATVSFEASTAWLTRTRAVVVFENPELQGQTNAVVNEAGRLRLRQMWRDWILAAEREMAAQQARAAIAPGTDADVA